jgi:membrane-bound lytic murein transglycosylase D
MKKVICVFTLALQLISCDSKPNSIQENTCQANIKKSISTNTSSDTVWKRIVDQFSFKNHNNQKLVQTYINKYKKDTSYLEEVSHSSSPYIYYIVTELEKRKLPTELAILPMVESNYKALAKSKMGAAGIWQIGSTTGKRYGLKQDSWYDGRHDIYASTAAALDYLEFLYKEFNKDWLLALAAYNSGEGRVRQAIKTNKRLKKPTDYWSLPLPKETKHFVPKLLAICHLLRNANKFNIDLKYVANNPYFINIKLNRQIGLQEAAQLAKITINDIKTLNPGYKQKVTHPHGPHQLLLPVGHVKIFKQNLTKKPCYKEV